MSSASMTVTHSQGELATAEVDEAELSLAERAELTRFEKVIERGLQTFVEVGNALAAIRDGKLYRGTHGTFEDYCRERWHIQRAHAYRLIESAAVVENLSPIGDILPANEAQARPLTKLEPEQQRQAWQEAVESSGGKPTAAHVEKAAVKFAEPKPMPAKPEPVQYAPVWALESAVKLWLRDVIGEDGTPNPDSVLDSLARQSSHSIGWFSMLETWVEETSAIPTFRKSDLKQAISNVREQRRVEQRKTQARAVYVEQKPEPVAVAIEEKPEPDLPFMPHDLDALGFVFVRRGERMWAIAHAGDAYESPWRYVPTDCLPDVRDYLATRPAAQPVEIEPDVDEQSVADAARGDAVGSGYFEILIDPAAPIHTIAPGGLYHAIQHATVEDLQAAVQRLPDELRRGREPVLLAALKKRGVEMVEREEGEGEEEQLARNAMLSKLDAEDRLTLARELFDLLTETREAMHRDFGELTGRYTLVPPLDRAVGDALSPLRSLISILEGNQDGIE